MSRRIKILILVVIIIAALIVAGYVIVKYTTWGMSYRVQRLHDQITKRYIALQTMYEIDQAKFMLTEELRQNRLVKSAVFSGDKLELCYIDQACEDFYVGVED